jgi:hypothetical protein
MSRCFPFPPPGYDKTARPHAQLAPHLLDKVALLPRRQSRSLPLACLAHSLTDRTPVGVARCFYKHIRMGGAWKILDYGLSELTSFFIRFSL